MKELKLTKDDVGKEFECCNESYPVSKMVYVSVTGDRFCFENAAGGLFIVDEEGKPLLFDTSIIKRHDTRWWLKDLPDADLFAYCWLACDSDGSWFYYKSEPIIDTVNFKVQGDIWQQFRHLDGIKMPELKGDDWKESKISIDELREWQRLNK